MFRSQIPESLWQNEKLLLPPALVGALREELQGRALYAEACVEDKPDSELFGGKDAEVKKIRDQYRANAERLPDMKKWLQSRIAEIGASK